MNKSSSLDKGTGDVNLIAAVEFIYKMLNKKSGELENTGESQENTGNTDNNYKKSQTNTKLHFSLHFKQQEPHQESTENDAYIYRLSEGRTG